MIGKLFERSPLGLTIARYTGSLSPVNMKEKPDLYCKWFKNLFQLNELKKLSTKECDKTIQEYKKLMLEIVARTPEFESYEKTQCRLDTSLFKTIGLEHCKGIEKVIKMVLCLNYRQELSGALVSTKAYCRWIWLKLP